jgi:hypothetical protein
MVVADKAKPAGYEALITEYIQKIDNEKSLFRVRDYFSALKSFIALTIVIAAVTLPTYYFSPIGDFEKLTILLAGLALIISVGQFELPTFQEKFMELNYHNAVNAFKPKKEEKPILKALVKMKSENTDFSLKEISKICPKMFTMEKLLEKLYESST